MTIETKQDAIDAIELIIKDCYDWREWVHDRHNFESMAEQGEKILAFLEKLE